MASGILFASFALLLFLAIPIGIALGLSALITIFATGTIPVEFIMRELITSLDSFTLLAVPFFIFAGDVMGAGGISERIFKFANSLVGNRTGGLAIATILTCMIFAAISGSGPATVAAIGAVMIPAMVKNGYDIKFATAIVTAAGSIGVIIPPSIPMVMYGATGSVSIGDLFIAGIIPGIFVGVIMAIYAYGHSKKMGYKGTDEKTSLKRVWETFWEAKWALLMPVIILGGIYTGFFTPTEAACVALVYGIIAAVFIYKELSLKDLPKIFINSSLTTATVLIIVGTATAFGRFLTIEQIPNKLAEALLSVSENPYVIMALIVIFLLFVGCIMDTTAAIIILTPILLPIAVQIGFDPIHFGVIMVVNLAIGFFTPPVGVNLFVATGITGLSIGTISRAVVPFIIAMIISLIIIIVLPELSLMLL